MTLVFQKPSIHRVENISANARTVDGSNGQFACLTISFHGPEDDDYQDMDVFFEEKNIHRAHSFAAIINAMSKAAKQAA